MTNRIMTLNEALARIRSRQAPGEPKVHFLACGFQPVHVGTFLKAQLLDRIPDNPVEILSGLYGDLAGNLDKADASPAIAAVVVIEWSDLDPRLGLRSSGGWSQRSAEDVASTVEANCARFEAAIHKLAGRMSVAVAPPGLPLPPVGHTIRSQSSVVELVIRQHLSALLSRLARIPGVRVADSVRLEQLSPSHARLDAKMELLAGFPYTVTHASALAGCLVEVLYQPTAKKALITDLDETVWAGIVGEIGPDAVTWNQESHSQIHGIYQQMLASLVDQGVLLAACSKNELSVVQTALARKDFLFSPETLFPVMASWGPKSRGVDEILRTWNIAADSVVFIDDNPLELDEVKLAHPGITCLQFFPKDPGEVWDLLGKLRDLFGKPAVLEEDRLRGASIRATSQLRGVGEQSGSVEFLRGLQGVVTIDCRNDAADMRPLELINKTNQFNLNGLRLSEGEWKRYLETPGSFAITVSYQDKFGPLGKIAVVLGQRIERRVIVSHWVMSCRAFSRQIEHHTLRALFQHSNADEIELAFKPTERNQPLQEFVHLMGVHQNGSCNPRLTLSNLQPQIERLPHQESYFKP